MHIKININVYFFEASIVNMSSGGGQLNCGNILVHVFIAEIDIYASVVAMKKVGETSWNLGPPKCKSRRTSHSVSMLFARMKLSQLCFEM